MSVTEQISVPFDIFYEKLNGLINFVINEYEKTFESQKISGLDDYIVALNDNLAEVEDKQTNQELYNEFQILLDIFEKLESEYPRVLKEATNFYQIIFVILNKLTSLDYSLFTALSGINTDRFKLIPFETNFKKFYFDKGNIGEAVVVFSLQHLDEFNEFINEFSLELLIHLLYNIDFTSESSPNSKYLLIDKASPVNSLELNAFMNLYEVAEGREIHSPHRYESKPSIHSVINWDHKLGYQQFDDTIYILSEYNFQKNIIDKYLKLYQVVENFMYRGPICSLVNSSGSMFSIREFQNLYKRVLDGEQDTLKKFTKNILEFEYDSSTSTKFIDIAFSCWQNCLVKTPTTKSEIDVFLKKLGYKDSYSDIIVKGNFSIFFAELIYKIRNCIVHNKETEFHLTYGNFFGYPGIVVLLEEFLIINLEEIIFNLLINKNDLVWYDYPQINLFPVN